jgi:hypothetical protein
MLSERTSTRLQTFLATLPSTVWRLVLSDQADHVVGVVVIDRSDDTAPAQLWNVEGQEVAQIARSTPIRALVETLLRAQCFYVR